MIQERCRDTQFAFILNLFRVEVFNYNTHFGGSDRDIKVRSVNTTVSGWEYPRDSPG